MAATDDAAFLFEFWASRPRDRRRLPATWKRRVA
jgi:hypothetical protein